MKQLQDNFTTPEQSKRLLELGVPADSADMLWDGCIDAKDGWVFEDFPIYTDKPFSYYQLLYRQEDVVHILPCWSVGRLLAICKMCEPKKDYEQLWDEMKYCENLCVLIISHIIANLPIINFSKLEDWL